MINKFKCMIDENELVFVENITQDEYLYHCDKCATYYLCNENEIKKVNQEKLNKIKNSKKSIIKRIRNKINTIISKSENSNWKEIKVYSKDIEGIFFYSYYVLVICNGQRIYLKTNSRIYKALDEKSTYYVKISRNLKIKRVKV